MSALRRLPLVLVAAGTGVTLLGIVVPAAAGADATSAVIRSAHFSPDTQGVDVYLAPFSGGKTQLWVSDEDYGTLSKYRRVTPGVYVVSMRPHGAPASTPAAVTWTLDAKPGQAYTAAAVGKNAALQAVILTDDLSTPKAGTGRVRVVQAASVAPAVTVVANGGVKLASALSFGATSSYASVPTGTWDVRATADSGSATAATSKVPVAAGSSSTIVVTDDKQGGLGLLSVVDSAAAGTAPKGSVDAGGGGMATSFVGATSDASAGGVPTWTWAAAVALTAGAGLVVTSRRRAARR